jgi:AcrR family transcriptional regulator
MVKKPKVKRNPATQTIGKNGSRGRRERRTTETRERLFRSALALFADKGFAETTVEDITEAADVGKGTFFNYFPSKDHILLGFVEMQLAKLQSLVAEARTSGVPMPQFLRSMALRMTQEPTRHPGIMRSLFMAYISTTPVRRVMADLQKRAHALHTEIMEMGQARGEIRKDLPASEIANVFRQTIFGTLLFWSLQGDASLPMRMESALNVLWSGMAPRDGASLPTESLSPEVPLVEVPLFTCGD